MKTKQSRFALTVGGVLCLQYSDSYLLNGFGPNANPSLVRDVSMSMPMQKLAHGGEGWLSSSKVAPLQYKNLDEDEIDHDTTESSKPISDISSISKKEDDTNNDVAMIDLPRNAFVKGMAKELGTGSSKLEKFEMFVGRFMMIAFLYIVYTEMIADGDLSFSNQLF